MQINNLIKVRLSTCIYSFYKQFHVLSQLISIYNQIKTKKGGRRIKKFIGKSF